MGTIGENEPFCMEEVGIVVSLDCKERKKSNRDSIIVE